METTENIYQARLVYCKTGIDASAKKSGSNKPKATAVVWAKRGRPKGSKNKSKTGSISAQTKYTATGRKRKSAARKKMNTKMVKARAAAYLKKTGGMPTKAVKTKSIKAGKPRGTMKRSIAPSKAKSKAITSGVRMAGNRASDRMRKTTGVVKVGRRLAQKVKGKANKKAAKSAYIKKAVDQEKRQYNGHADLFMKQGKFTKEKARNTKAPGTTKKGKPRKTRAKKAA